jgi:hypothetical protein
MNLENRIAAFSKLGEQIRIASSEKANNQLPRSSEKLQQLIFESKNYNGWFVPENVRFMMSEIGNSLKSESLEKWLLPYAARIEKQFAPKKVAVVMAGNIPAVGFNDLLAVLVSGNSILAKLSSGDNRILLAIAEMLIEIEPEFEQQIEFTENQLKNFDAVIATGSNNSARYFEYYFGKYPHIIRKNRNGIAVLDGSETKEELEKLADDIFLYFGLGCRNVSKIFVPINYDFQRLLPVLEARKEVVENNKYFNNYEYNKAIYLVNGVPHFDTGNLMLVENEQISSPVSVLYYSFYENKNALNELLDSEKDNIQCVVASKSIVKNSIPFGESQKPNLWDYADQVDVIEFLLSI